jgi:hypothetical protein
VLPLKRTLGDMRSELQTRLGFGMSGQAGIVNSPIMGSFLRSAQEQLYTQFDWRELCVSDEILTGTDQSLYDYPVDCNVERIRTIAIWEGVGWLQLEEGISLDNRSLDMHDRPFQYERGAQLEVWPTPRGQYRMRREYVKTLDPFEESSDRCSLPSEAVFLFALANAKAHYRQPDAERYEKQMDALLSKLKAQHRGRSVWSKPRPYDTRAAKAAFYSYPR